MGSNFNVGSFNAINTDEENKTKKTNKGGNEDLKKKLIFLGAIILGGVLVLFLVLFLLSFLVQKSYSYDEIEDIMRNAAVQYFKDHPNKLPENENQIVEIDASTLSSYEYMDPLSEYTKEGVNCTGKVSVQTNGSDYLYIPRLECGDAYTTTSLKEAVTQDVVTEGYGLYQVGDSYVYRGELVDNYVQLDLALWRIVKITSDGQFMLIYSGEDISSMPWDDRYNSQVGYNRGINNYSASRIKDSLEELYQSNEEDAAILSDDDRSKLVSFDLCIGKRGESDTSKDNSIECSETYANQKLGLLTVSDYMTASLDENCQNVLSRACQNYNYLNNNQRFWLLTATSDNTSDVYGVDTSGVIEMVSASGYKSPRPVVMLDANVMLDSGKGTLEKPYKLK